MDNQFEDRNRRFHEACRRSVIEQVPWLVVLEDQERLAVEAVMTHLVEDKFAADFGLAEPPGGALLEDPLEVSGIRETYLKDITDVWDAVFWPMRDVPGMARYVLMVLRHGDVVYHILPRDDWETAQFNGDYEPASLEKDGFIHCSRIDQVLRVANAFYKDLEDLLLLCIATEELEAEVKYEDLLGEGMSFPHLYGPLNLDAVAAVFELQKDSEGTFSLPR